MKLGGGQRVGVDINCLEYVWGWEVVLMFATWGVWQTTFTSSVSVVLGKSRCHVTWFSSTCKFFFFVEKIHMQFNRPCKNKIKRNYVIYQTLQNYGSKKEKWKPYGTLMNFFQKIHSFFLLKKKKKRVIFLAEKYVPHFFLHGL